MVEQLLERGLLNEASGYLRERIAASRSTDLRTTLLIRLAEVEYRREALGESLQLLEIATGLVSTKEQNRDLERLKKTIIANLPDDINLVSDPLPDLIDDDTEFEADADGVDSFDDEEPRVSASFYELNIQQALLELSYDAGVPIVWDRKVEGLVTFETVDKPLEEVLAAILGPSGYTFRKVSGVYHVGQSDSKGPGFAILSETVIMTLSSIAADEAVSLLSAHFRPYVQATTKSNNLVCITAPAALAERIRQDLLMIDRPPAQVLIEVMVVEIRTDFLRAHGIDWYGSKTGDPTSWTAGTSLMQSLTATLGGDLSTEINDVFGSRVDISAGLRALVSDGVAEIRASPRLTTLNGRPAQIGISQDQYFIISDTSNQGFYGYSRIEAVKATIAVQITPFVGLDNMLTLSVQPQVGDVVGEGDQGLPVIFNRSASTTIRVRDGETFSIGGLNTTKIKERKRRIPILGHIPLLGILFRYEEKSTIESEVIIFVTPHVLPS